VVFDGGAGEDEAVGGVEEADGFGGFGGGVFDGLGFVEDGVVEGEVLEEDDVAEEGAVGGEDEVVVSEGGSVAGTRGGGVVEDFELGGKAGGFLLPVIDEGTGNDGDGGRGAGKAAGFQEGENLRSFADAHIVGKAAAEAEALEEVHPGEPFALVVSELAVEGRGFVGRLDGGELAELVAEVTEDVVGTDFGALGEEDIEESGLTAVVAERVSGGLTEFEEVGVAGEEIVGDEAEGAVVEFDELGATLEGFEELGEGGFNAAAVVDEAAEFEPVDVAGEFGFVAERLAEGLTVDGNLPAALGEALEDGGQAGGGEFPGSGREGEGGGGAADAGGFQFREPGLFGGGIAAEILAGREVK
jgi:hypothetical protein